MITIVIATRDRHVTLKHRTYCNNTEGITETKIHNGKKIKMKLDEKTKQYRNTVCLEIKQKILNLKYFQTLSLGLTRKW